MSNRFHALAFAGLLAIAPLSAASAQAIVIESDTMISVEEARDIAMSHGVDEIESIELDTNDGSWSVEGVDIDDRDIDLEIDARTGAVLSVDR